MPNVFSISGWLGGWVLFVGCGQIAVLTMFYNTAIARKYPGTNGYSKLCNQVFGKFGKLTIDISIWIFALAKCCGYLYFIAEQIDSVICHYTSTTDLMADGWCTRKNFYILMLSVPVLPVCWIKTYTFLSYFNMLGAGLGLIAFVFMFGYMGADIHRSSEE